MISEKEIQDFGKAFPLIRTATGWSAEEFGEHIGVKRQSINNYENQKPITKTHYIAMRYVLDTEIEERPEETKLLQVVLDAYVDRRDEYTDEDREEIAKKVRMVSTLQSKRVSKNDLSNILILNTIELLFRSSYSFIGASISNIVLFRLIFDSLVIALIFL